jgi:hypothetical protein
VSAEDFERADDEMDHGGEQEMFGGLFKFHRHVWTVKKEETHPSPWEQIEKGAGRTKINVGGGTAARMHTRSVIVTYKCASCPAEKVVRL